MKKKFIATNAICIIALFILILAGGVVRSTGSGMGCPDWPKCFGHYVPPVSKDQLPPNYQSLYVKKRVAKNTRIAKILYSLGFHSLALKFLNDKSIFNPEEFNAFKSWTEYINRLIGVAVGLLILLCAILSIAYLQSCKTIVFLSFCNLIFVALQAWLGSVVVSSNLLPWTVTIHMLVALIIIAISIYTYFHACALKNHSLLNSQNNKSIKLFTLITLFLVLVQITLGTDLREKIDSIAILMHHGNRSQWIWHTGIVLDLHRYMALLVTISQIGLFLSVRMRYTRKAIQFKITCYSIFILILQMIMGAILAYCALPRAAQSGHVFLATLLFGSLFYLLLLIKKKSLTTVA